jgi:hypothetical protein
MKALTALMVVGAIVLGAVLLVPMTLGAYGSGLDDGIASSNGDRTMDKTQVGDQAKDGSCDQCGEDLLDRQNQTGAQDGNCGGCECVDGTSDPACDQVKERNQTQEHGMCGQVDDGGQMQNHEQDSNQFQDRSCTMSKGCKVKA